MIIKFIPETDKERETMHETEHAGVKEFFMFGNKIDGDGNLIEFNDWNGSYKMLIGNLSYFQKIVENEMYRKLMRK